MLFRSSGGKISFKSKNVGIITIPLEKIARLETHNATIIKFLDGRIVRVSGLDVTHAPFALTTAEGIQTYALTDIDVINPEEWLLGRGIHRTGRFSLSYNMETGNTEKTELDYDLAASLENLKVRWRFQAYGEIDTESAEKTKDKYTVIFKSDRFRGGGAHIGVNALIEADEFSELIRRDVIGAYYGKQWYTSAKVKFALDSGLAFVNEARTDQRREQFPGATWTLDIMTRLLGGSTETELRQIGLWNLRDTSDVALYTLLTATYPITHRLGIVARLLFDYDSGVPQDIERLDRTFKLGLSYKW